MVATEDEKIVCEHPPALLRHLGRSLWGCLDCGHTGHREGRPYFCSLCPEVHSLTYAEYVQHKTEVHGANWGKLTRF